MLKRLKNWLHGRSAVAEEPPGAQATEPPRRPAAKQSSAPTPKEDAPVERKFVREETGTYESLKILDSSITEDSPDDGADPYNTGGFDRSRNWDKRFSNK